MTEQSATPLPGERPRYIIDPERCQELGRSLEEMIFSRRCSSCQARLSQSPQLPALEEQIREIAECCSRVDGYIRPELPLLEIVFRTLLAEGNRPLGLEELHEVVSERWATPTNPKNISAEDLRRILSSDNYYCFRQLSQASESS